MSQPSTQKEFVQLINQHQKLIHSLCSLYFPASEDRKDLFQEIVLQLWKAYPTFRGHAKLSTWIYRIALNTVFARIRKEKTRPTSEPLSEQSFQVALIHEEMTPSTQDLYWAIGRLGDIDKAIIMLYLEEHSYDEIATIVGMSRTNISTRINRIKTKLGQLLTNS